MNIDAASVRALLKRAEIEDLIASERVAGTLAARLAARNRAWSGRRPELIAALGVLRRVELRRTKASASDASSSTDAAPSTRAT